MDNNNGPGRGGRGRFFRGRFNWYNKRGSRGRGGKSAERDNSAEVDPEEGLRDRSSDLNDDSSRAGASRSRMSKPRGGDDSSGPETSSRPKQQKKKTIDSALREQWEGQCPGYALYFPRDPVIDKLSEKLEAAKDYLQRVELQNERKILEVEEKEFYDVNYSNLVGDAVLMEAWPDLPNELQDNPKDVLSLWGLALYGVVTETIRKIEAESSSCDEKRPDEIELNISYIRFGIMRADPVTPLMSIKASCLGKFLTVRGAIVRTGVVKPFCIRQTFRCLKCFKTFPLDQPDGYYTLPKFCKASDECTNKNEFEPVLSAAKVIDYRRIRIQDVENSHLEQGRIPRTIDCDLFYDLVNHCNAGDIITVSGVVKMSRESSSSTDQSLHNLYIEAYALNNHKDSDRTMGGNWFSFTNKDYYAVKEIFETEKLFRLLVASLCPSIFGMELVKAGVLLALFGGTHQECELLERRSDINVLLVGDPGMGKSQMLKMVSEVAPRGVYVCGSGSTTAGLTVTLVRDGDEYSLEAGALVMADKGVCCIDEFDKMQSQHNALLEAMEQQCVSIAKAGVFRTIPARTSVLAAANPVGGHYDNARSVTENIKIAAPLLSRFDLTFILQDRPDEIHDRNIVQHIMGPTKSQESKDGALQDSSRLSQASSDSLRARLLFLPDEEADIIPQHLLRKYIAYARQYVHPKLSPEAAAVIKEHYLELRKNHRHVDSTPVTTRQLESLKRLTEARAKTELREVATEQDARDVVEIFKYSMSGVYENDKDNALGFTQEVMEASIRSAELTPSARRSLGKNLAKRLAGELERAAANRSNALFTVDDIRDIARKVQIESGVEDLIDTLNNNGHLIKKGPRTYQFMC